MSRPIMLALAIDVPADEWLTANGRVHPMVRHRRTKALRLRAATLMRSIRPAKMRAANVTATICYPTARRADPSNALPTVKALIDGIVSDYGLLPDDDHTHLPRLAFERGPDTKRPGWYRIVLTFEELS